MRRRKGSSTPRLLGEIHTRTQTPAAALVANFCVGVAALLTGQTEQIILIAVFGALTLYIVSSAALVVLRRREPALARPYRTPLYPYAPIVAIALSLLCVAAMAWTYPWIALIYVVLIGAAWLLFILLSSRS